LFTDEFRRTIEASPRQALPELASAMWKAYGAGQISEAEAEDLSVLIEARRALPVAPDPLVRRVGSRPRTPASVGRRRSWAASGRLPPNIAAQFTPAEAAVLAVLAVEVRRSGDCRWPHAKLAAVAGVSESTVKRALRAARDLGLISTEERRLSAWRSDTNVTRIISSEWQAWLRIRGGGQAWPRNDKKTIQEAEKQADRAEAYAEPQKGRRGVRLVDQGKRRATSPHRTVERVMAANHQDGAGRRPRPSEAI
jgi:hypothetical protein